MVIESLKKLNAMVNNAINAKIVSIGLALITILNLRHSGFPTSMVIRLDH
jgi:hypothetical protein